MGTQEGSQLQVKGYVEKDGVKQSHPLLHGTWDGALKASWQDGTEQLLWQKNPPHEHPSRCASRYLRSASARSHAVTITGMLPLGICQEHIMRGLAPAQGAD